jgi:hypothetical protein
LVLALGVRTKIIKANTINTQLHLPYEVHHYQYGLDYFCTHPQCQYQASHQYQAERIFCMTLGTGIGGAYKNNQGHIDNGELHKANEKDPFCLILM